MTSRSFDWAAIRAAWCAGESAHALAQRFGVAHSTILRRVRRETWLRSLPRVTAARPDQDRVLAAHRVVIQQGQVLTLRLLEEVQAACAQLDALADEPGPERAAALAKRSAALRDLAQAARLWIALERQAWGLKDQPGDDAPRHDLDAALACLAPGDRAELRRIAEIAAGRPAGPVAEPRPDRG
ncbi:helix-turn-helix domain-containing protein [Methylobacterium sp. JK268]